MYTKEFTQPPFLRPLFHDPPSDGDIISGSALRKDTSSNVPFLFPHLIVVVPVRQLPLPAAGAPAAGGGEGLSRRRAVFAPPPRISAAPENGPAVLGGGWVDDGERRRRHRGSVGATASLLPELGTIFLSEARFPEAMRLERLELEIGLLLLAV